jgi:two-component sensor histidine kinase
VGLPAGFELARSKSLGLQLVADLVRQLQGTLETGPGATFTVTFRPTLAGRGSRSPFPATPP